MAWDSSSFAWEWDAETFHPPASGAGADYRKSTENNHPPETGLCVGKNGIHINKKIGPALATKSTISLHVHDSSQSNWSTSPRIYGHANGLNGDVVHSATSSAKHNGRQVDWHINKHENNSCREGGLVAVGEMASSTKQERLHVDWHCNQQAAKFIKEENSTVFPAPSSAPNNSNISWLHVNGFLNLDSENTYNMKSRDGMIGPDNVARAVTGVIPIVTTCTGIGNGSITCNDNFESIQNSRKVPEKENGGSSQKIRYAFAHVLDAGTQQCSLTERGHQQNAVSKEEMQLSAVKVVKGTSSTSKDSGTQQIDEQHSSNATGSAGSGDSFIGLHLGKRTYSHDGLKATANKSAQKAVLPPKRSRTAVSLPRCQVEGCKLDLTSAKDYHRRHKVCEPHSKAGKVVVAGREQRFCQQCSRFHSLSEFDEAKRSCRRRLAGHNERRRKPQPDPLTLHARLHSTFEDWPFLHHSRLSRMPLFWQDPGEIRSNGIWPRMISGLYGNQSVCDYGIQESVTERGLVKNLSQRSLGYHDKVSMLLQSPKLLRQTSAGYERAQNYSAGGLDGLMGDGLTLAPSSGVLPGLDTTPVTRGVTRVSDSGRALSLLSLQTQGSHDSDVWIPDPLGLANSAAAFGHEIGHHEEVFGPQQFLIQGAPQYFNDVSVEKSLVPLSLSNSQPHSDGAHLGPLISFERDIDDCSVVHDLDRQTSNHPSFALLPFHQEDGLSQVGRHEDAG
ncbi:hypothetical protein KP509_20G021600 [Ceratopteris richardii]|uniref:SBP-type domain-containing protein n=1 Tax=Ceratopteris richardii TaxID=49495 RepID=A0A8T2SDQ8_CERRI|nr:hypothetical protein KP509_20G021600 [Ceratopteris richardii]